MEYRLLLSCRPFATMPVPESVLLRWLLPPSRLRRRAENSEAIWSAIAVHLKNPGLLVTFCVGAMVLFSIVAAFTYINYRLAAPPYDFSPGALSALFAVYLVGAVITPFAGKIIDRFGFRKAYAAAIICSLLGMLMTLSANFAAVVVGLSLSLFCTGIFVCQSATTASLRVLAPTQRSAAAGLYVCFYYLGGSLGAYLPGLIWDSGGWGSCVALIALVQIAALLTAWFFWRTVPVLAGSK